MSSFSRPSADVTALQINAGRAALGAAFLAAPAGMVRLLGLDAATAARASWLVRVAGVRDVALGVGAVQSVVRRRDPMPWIWAGALCDLVDAVVMAMAANDRRVDPVRGRLVAGGAAVTGVIAAVSGVGVGRRAPH